MRFQSGWTFVACHERSRKPPGAVDGKGGHHGLRDRRRRIRILCSSDFCVDFSVGEQKRWVLIGPGSFGIGFFWGKIGRFWEIAHGFHESIIYTKQGFRGNGRLLGKFVAQIKSKGTKWMENVTRKVGPPRVKDHI